MLFRSRGFPERDEHRGDAAQQDLHAFAHQEQIGIVGDVRARGAEMQERARRGRLIAEMITGATPFCDPEPYSVARFGNERLA